LYEIDDFYVVFRARILLQFLKLLVFMVFDSFHKRFKEH